jgi:hypothetical protein
MSAGVNNRKISLVAVKRRPSTKKESSSGRKVDTATRTRTRGVAADKGATIGRTIGQLAFAARHPDGERARIERKLMLLASRSLTARSPGVSVILHGTDHFAPTVDTGAAKSHCEHALGSAGLRYERPTALIGAYNTYRRSARPEVDSTFDSFERIHCFYC